MANPTPSVEATIISGSNTKQNAATTTHLKSNLLHGSTLYQRQHSGTQHQVWSQKHTTPRLNKIQILEPAEYPIKSSITTPHRDDTPKCTPYPKPSAISFFTPEQLHTLLSRTQDTNQYNFQVRAIHSTTFPVLSPFLSCSCSCSFSFSGLQLLSTSHSY